MSFDYVLATAAAVIVASVIVLGSFLSRYSSLVQEADKSTRLAKDVWDSLNTRFSVVDTRIIDLMAKTEVISSRVGLAQPYPQARVSSASIPSSTASRANIPIETSRATIVASQVAPIEGTETEVRVLRLLAEGPRTSAQIKEEVGRSREHTARMMKALFDRGLVIRNDRNKPYVYEITESGKSYVAS